jgi:plastocyanin
VVIQAVGYVVVGAFVRAGARHTVEEELRLRTARVVPQPASARRSLTALAPLAIALVALLLGASGAPAQAPLVALDATVTDETGALVADAVVSLTLVGAALPPTPAPTAVMDQQNKTFVPHVLPVRLGAAVSFPNRDSIRHHVYSFSAAKRFELPLYIGTPAKPVVFDKPGVVVLGCNIHDWMLGYIYVVSTPYFGRTGADGRVRVADVPAGRYEARVWHPRLRAETETTTKAVELTTGEPAALAFVVSLKPDRRPPPPRPTYETTP